MADDQDMPTEIVLLLVLALASALMVFALTCAEEASEGSEGMGLRESVSAWFSGRGVVEPQPQPVAIHVLLDEAGRTTSR